MAAGNQTQIPIIQTEDNNQNLIQQNINKVLRNLNNTVVALQSSLSETTIIGEIKIANLTVSQFQSIAGIEWFLCNGQSCVNTAYSQLTGRNTVPNISLGSINNFIRVN